MDNKVTIKDNLVEEKPIDKAVLLEMSEAGVLYSHKKSKTHPKMKRYIVINRHEINLLDARAVLDSLEKASEFVKSILSKNGLVLFVGTQPAARSAIKETAEKFGQPYIVSRWLGGTFTNFKVVKKSIDKYVNLKRQRKSGELEKYTKKEQLKFSREIDKMSEKFEGLVDMDRLPDAVFVVDTALHGTAVREANRENIPVIALVDGNDDPTNIEYPIIANDRSRNSIEWVIENLVSKIGTVKKETPSKKEEEDKKFLEDNKEGK